MSRYTDPLSHVKVAAPCSVGWENMIGNERLRFCGQCNLNVYNLSDMTKREAEDLIRRAEGRLCVRFYRRADGTILTNNCPVGLRAIERRLSRVASATLSAILSFFAGLGIYTTLKERDLTATTGEMAITRQEELPVSMGKIKVSPTDEPSDGWIEGQMTYKPVVGQLVELPQRRKRSLEKYRSDLSRR